MEQKLLHLQINQCVSSMVSKLVYFAHSISISGYTNVKNCYVKYHSIRMEYMYNIRLINQ